MGALPDMHACICWLKMLRKLECAHPTSPRNRLASE